MSLLVRVVAIIVSPRGLATLRAGLGVALLFEQLPEILLVLGGGAEPDLLVVADANGSATATSRSSEAIRVTTFSTVCALHHRLVAILVQTPSGPLRCSRGGNLYIWKNSVLVETRI